MREDTNGKCSEPVSTDSGALRPLLSMSKDHLLDADEVIRHLEQETERVGGQSEWARLNGVNRSTLNQVLNRRRPPTKQMVSALGLRQIVLPTRAELVKRLIEEVEKAGSQTELARRIGLNRTYLTHVLNGRKPGSEVIKALHLTRVVKYLQKKKKPKDVG